MKARNEIKAEIEAIKGALNKSTTRAQDKPAIKAVIIALSWVIGEATSIELVHGMNAENLVEVKKAKRVPLYKDKAAVEALSRQIIEEHNQKIKRAIEKGDKGLKLTKHEQIIYNLYLQKTKPKE